MKTRIALSVKCSSKSARDQLESVLAPDNVGGPEGMRFSVGGAGRSLSFRVRSATASTAISTTVALLRDVALFQEVWLLSRAKDA